tara:strand:- start:219 stop:533 length:315 start_codon:yes stop_codon:yes gene_type:complete
MLLGGVAMNAAADPAANPFAQQDQGWLSLSQFKAPPQNNLLPGKPRSRVGNQQAASRAKQRFPESKVLSVNLDSANDRYRVKVLTNGGVVKYVYVDARDGEIFE